MLGTASAAASHCEGSMVPRVAAHTVKGAWYHGLQLTEARTTAAALQTLKTGQPSYIDFVTGLLLY